MWLPPPPLAPVQKGCRGSDGNDQKKRYQYEGPSSDLLIDTVFFWPAGRLRQVCRAVCGSRRSPPVRPNGEIKRYQLVGPSSDLLIDTVFFWPAGRLRQVCRAVCGSRRSPPVRPNGEIKRYQLVGPSSDLLIDTVFFGLPGGSGKSAERSAVAAGARRFDQMAKSSGINTRVQAQTSVLIPFF